MFEGVLEVLRLLKNVEHLRKEMAIIFDDVGKNVKNNELGGRFIDIGLENVAVAAARVLERPPRCSHKGGQKCRCL